MSYKVYCEATTKQGSPCKIEAEPGSTFCHVHDPALQCGFVKRNGKRCTIATGGRGPCQYHREGAGKNPDWNKRSHRKMRYTPEERRERRAERERLAAEAIAELDRIRTGAPKPNPFVDENGIDWFGVNR